MITPFTRVRFLLKATKDFFIPGQQGALVYALLCNANAKEDSGPAFPRDFMLDVPEQSRTTVRRGDHFAFGGTLIAPRPETTESVIQTIAQGLQRVGGQSNARKYGLGGNFELEQIEDLVAGNEFQKGPLEAVPSEHIDQEVQALLALPEFTLRFISPIRVERPGRSKERGGSFYDDRLFDARQFVRRIVGRLQSIGIQLRDSNHTIDWETAPVETIENRLVWLDMAYGGEHGKTIGGVCGRLRLKVSDPILIAAIVWGQYSRVGKNSNFGFGRYRVEELGPEPFACRRATSLLELAWNHPSLDRLVMKSGLESGIVTQAFQEHRQGTYSPHPCARVEIGEGEKRRQLQIPSRRDRVMQRLVLETIGPGIDQLFEASSFAWRKGLGRHSSAKAISKAYSQGYHFSIQADFDRFFDSIPVEKLLDRLEVYVGDSSIVDIIKVWIRPLNAGERGIPTGAPISPLLGNLMLDRFDERIQSMGGKLIRDGEDFLVLFKNEEDAKSMLQSAINEATALELQLNEGPSSVLELNEPFQFLGFQFEKSDTWRKRGSLQPKRLEELGWHDASSQTTKKRASIQLPGENGLPAMDFGLTAILGPNATSITLQGKELQCHYAGGVASTSVSINDLECLVVLGSIGMSSGVVAELTSQQINMILADERGNAHTSISGDYDQPPEVIAAQVDASRHQETRLNIAKELVGAKLHNYARLAMSVDDQKLGSRLLELSLRALQMSDIEKLRGVEGSGAALWYGQIGKHLGSGFSFERRVAPNADDPVNVLLNIAFTQLYRLTLLAIRASGLNGSIGFLHTSMGRFQTLATDLQEPFRFLMDRAVLQATSELRPKDFKRVDNGPYPLSLAPEAARTFQLLLWKGLHLGCQSTPESEPISYLVHIQREARRLRRSLVGSEFKYQAFRLP